MNELNDSEIKDAIILLYETEEALCSFLNKYLCLSKKYLGKKDFQEVKKKLSKSLKKQIEEFEGENNGK